MFTVASMEKACSATSLAARLEAKPLQLLEGDKLTLDDLVVGAYAHSDEFIPSVPVSIAEGSVSPAILKKDPDAMRVTYIAIAPGKATFVIEPLCLKKRGVAAEATITVKERLSVGSI